MRYDQEVLEDAIQKKLGVTPVAIVSCKYVGSTDQWVARLSDFQDTSRQYYRIAEGIGKDVTFVSPRMPSNITAYTGRLSKARGRGADREMRNIAHELTVECDRAERIRKEFGSRIDWLFEGRDV
jgi:hypothetical protein